MLKKYENFIKLSKNQQCSLYSANRRDDMNSVLIKRFKSNWSWNQMLKSQTLRIQSNQDCFPKILQIFKMNKTYFIVYEKPYGPPLGFLQQSAKPDLSSFYYIFTQLINSVTKLRQQIFNLYIYPEWIFLHRNGVKICHFEPYFQAKKSKQKDQNHVFIFSLMNGQYQNNQTNVLKKGKRIKNLNFNLGYIAYHLLTGITTNFDQENFLSKAKQIRINAQNNILKQTNDKVLSSLITKLLNCTDDDGPFQIDSDQAQLFQKFKGYMNRKQIQCRNCKNNRQNFRIVEFSLQKMKLQKKMSKIKVQKKKKCIRPCCFKTFKDQPNPQEEEQNDEKYKVVERFLNNDRIQSNLKTQNQSAQSRKKVKQKTLTNLKNITRYKINASCVLPQLGTYRKNTTFMQKIKHGRHRSTIFRNQMEAARTTKDYLKTEY